MTMEVEGKLETRGLFCVYFNVFRSFFFRCIAVNYVARARGVKRSMRGDEAKAICSDLELVRVPVVRGKADLSKYRNAGKHVAAVLQTFTPLMTRASVDEAYLDLTERVNNRLSDMNQASFIHSVIFW